MIGTLLQVAALAACRHLSMQQVIGCAVPEYGGFYYDSAATVVLLRDTTSAAAATPIIRLFFGMDRGSPPRVLRIVKAKYTYNQLEAFYKKMGRLPKGVTSIAINGRCNCVEIGSIDEGTDRSMRRLIKKIKLPEDAFSVERRAPATVAHDSHALLGKAKSRRKESVAVWRWRDLTKRREPTASGVG